MTWSGSSIRLCSFFRVSKGIDRLSLQHVSLATPAAGCRPPVEILARQETCQHFTNISARICQLPTSTFRESGFNKLPLPYRRAFQAP